MSKRKRRRERANKKRDYYKSVIALLIRDEIIKKMESGFSERAAINDGIISGLERVDDLIKLAPREAHLIRQGALKFKRDIDGILNKN